MKWNYEIVHFLKVFPFKLYPRRSMWAFRNIKWDDSDVHDTKSLIPKRAKSIFVTSEKKRNCLPDFVQASMEKWYYKVHFFTIAPKIYVNNFVERRVLKWTMFWYQRLNFHQKWIKLLLELSSSYVHCPSRWEKIRKKIRKEKKRHLYNHYLIMSYIMETEKLIVLGWVTPQSQI